ncbi:MAG: MFS transporter [Polyangiaceae bacterium]|nr:MFS transporter [Polyangiaceae bacterium]
MPRRAPIVVGLVLGMALAALEATVVSTVMPTVVAELGGLELYGWVGAAYLLAATVTTPVFGKLADQWGRRPLVLGGMALFLAGSAACGAARSMAWLIAFRAVQGVGAGCMQPVSLTVIGDLFDIEERGKVQGAFGAVWAVSGIVGPLVGGALVAVASWRWVFYLNLPIGLLAIAILVVSLRDAEPPRGGRVDWAGAALVAIVGTALLLAVSGRGVLVALVVLAAAVPALIVAERRASDPVLPFALLASRPLAVASALGLLLGAVMMGTLHFVPLHVQGVLGDAPARAGGAVAAMLVGWPIAAYATGRTIPRVGFRAPVRLGVAVVLLGASALALAVGTRAPVGAIAAASFLLGVGLGFANTAVLIGVQLSAVHAQRGVATASTIFMRSTGGAVGVGALGALLALEVGGGSNARELERLLARHGGALSAGVVETLATAVLHVCVAMAILAALAVVVALAYPAVAVPVTGGNTSPAVARSSPGSA